MHFENNNIIIHIFENNERAIVMFKRELFVSDVIDDVAEELNNLNFSGVVVFDEKLLKGIDDCYYQTRFYNRVFDLSNFVLLSKPDYSLIEFSRNYYREHLYLFERSNLARKQQEKMMKWLIE